jgi:hypothetical protein
MGKNLIEETFLKLFGGNSVLATLNNASQTGEGKRNGERASIEVTCHMSLLVIRDGC